MPHARNKPSWLQILGIVGLGLALFAMFSASPVAAVPRPPRPDLPTVELVKVFRCDYADNFVTTDCSVEIEQHANAWLQEKQPGIRVVARRFTATDNRVLLAIFYEVPEWRTSQPKPPAEAVR